MAYPKITYTPLAGGSVQTLQFARPPRFVAAYNRSATRHDNLSTAGVKEVVVERVDHFLELTLEYVGIGSDVTAWATFMAEALQGALCNYFPDASQADYTTYTLEDTDWKAEYKAPAQYTFKVLFRQVVT
jgi:hypothetical protein